jgi:RimJ/RimL family protein N-acetyltransferase
MALIKPVEFISKKGKKITIRNLDGSEALKTLQTMTEISETSPFILSTTADFRKMTEEQERKFILSHNESPRKLFLVAEVENRIAGILNFSAFGDSKRFHRGSLGVSLHNDFRGEGIAKKMMEVLIEFTRTLSGFRYLELEVFDLNQDAIKLYENLGFKTLHITPNAFVLADGQQLSEVKMRLEVST